MAAGASTASLQQQTQTLDRLFTALDPKSLILSQFSQSPNNLLQLTAQDTLERGPRYEAYANLRESKIRSKKVKQFPPQDLESSLTPPKKQLKYQGSLPTRRKGSSVLTQSVPDFSSAIRKENRKPPAAALPPVMEKSATPPAKSSRSYGIPARLGGSKSANSSGEKRINGGMLGARKSYANLEELKGLSCAAASAINGENRGLRSGRTIVGKTKTILGYRQS